MKAIAILQSIQPHMSKTRIFGLIEQAIVELDLKDTSQVAVQLGVTKAAVYKRAGYHNIGFLIARRARVYSPSDVEELRKLIFEYKGQQPATLAMVAEMKILRVEGQTLIEIGKEFGVSGSYVSKLLKGAKDE